MDAWPSTAAFSGAAAAGRFSAFGPQSPVSALRSSFGSGRVPLPGCQDGPCPIWAGFKPSSPRASKNAIASYTDGILAVRLTAPPVEGAANEACRAFLADVLDIAKSRIEIATGERGRNKILEITGISADDVSARVAQALRKP